MKYGLNRAEFFRLSDSLQSALREKLYNMRNQQCAVTAEVWSSGDGTTYDVKQIAGAPKGSWWIEEFREFV